MVKQNLRVPGPTPCPEDVLLAGAQPMINHRGPEFRDLIFRVTAGLKKVFSTENDILTLTASGSGALEACIANFFSPGDQVLAITIGAFGDRFAKIAGAYGTEVIRLESSWGEATDHDKLRTVLRDHRGIKGVLITHNETSTGVTNDLAGLAGVVKNEFNKLLIVDAISSLGCIPVSTDLLQLDVVATASQKGFMVPPGLAFISVSPTAWKAYENASIPRFYFDLMTAKRYLQEGQTPWTPAVSLLFAMDRALELMLAEGLPNVYSRHLTLGNMMRKGVKSLGLSLFPKNETYASNTVTAVNIPVSIESTELITVLAQKWGIVVAGGQGKLSDKIFRVGHLGHIDQEDIENVLEALKMTLLEMQFEKNSNRKK